MKGSQGLIIALVLGLLGGTLNFLYLQTKTRDVQRTSFVGIRPGKAISVGDVFTEGDLIEVPIPEKHSRDLKGFVYLWENYKTIVGITATKPYQGGEFVYLQDYRTPPPELKLGDKEKVIWITVDSGSFVPSLLDPGDEISFIVPPRAAAGAGNVPLGPPQTVGPFRIASLGNRLSSRGVFQGRRKAQVQERQIGIIVHIEGNQMEAKATKLIELLSQGDSRGLRVQLDRKKEKE